MYLQKGTLLHGGMYRIVRFINSGGFGCTYEAEHVMLEKKMAIKEFFPHDFCNRDAETSHVTVGTESKRGLVDKLRGKFVDEAKAIGRLEHPGIVRVSDVFEENGTAYYVMDYIKGSSLSDIVEQKGRLPESQALRYIRQVADALRYVHDNSRLHLDIKPGNIMVNANDDAVLIDFGASKQYDEENGENTSTLMGRTPGYAPPEQMGNDVRKFMPATDIYALGATLYKLLTGVTPLKASDRSSGDELDPLPSYVSASTANAIAAAMQLNKKLRPQSIAEFLNLFNADVSGSVHDDKTDEVTVLGYEKPSDDKTQFLVNRTPSDYKGHEYVDLGLSVKWATCNVGANSPSDYGDYFAWGETETKSSYNVDNCATWDDSIGDIAGDSHYDAALANWGGSWRMPTASEIDELIDKCKREWTTLGNHKGYKVTGSNGNSIFLPAAGWRVGPSFRYQGEDGFYWSSTPYEDSTNDAYYLHLGSGKFYNVCNDKDIGRSIRPVSE